MMILFLVEKSGIQKFCGEQRKEEGVGPDEYVVLFA